MKAGELQILLHHHVTPDPWPYGSSPFYQATVREFKRQGLLDADGEVTPKVITFIERLKAVPLDWETAFERTQRERDAYKRAAEDAGVCMTCVIQAPDPYGCADCLNTGWSQGDPYERVKQLEKELADISAAIGSVEFMDPPDGGSVSLAEQVRRMRQELEKHRV